MHVGKEEEHSQLYERSNAGEGSMTALVHSGSPFPISHGGPVYQLPVRVVPKENAAQPAQPTQPRHGGSRVTYASEDEVSDSSGSGSDSDSDVDARRRHRSRVYVPKEGVEIFVGGLTRSTRRYMLRDWFQHLGEVTEVRIARDKRRRRCRGYGYVRYRDSADAERAIATMHRFEFKPGRFLGVMPSDDNRTLFVGNLCEEWNGECVESLLRDSRLLEGISKIEPIADKEDPTRSRGFCFVEFVTHAAAAAAHARFHVPHVRNAAAAEGQEGAEATTPPASSQSAETTEGDEGAAVAATAGSAAATALLDGDAAAKGDAAKAATSSGGHASGPTTPKSLSDRVDDGDEGLSANPRKHGSSPLSTILPAASPGSDATAAIARGASSWEATGSESFPRAGAREAGAAVADAPLKVEEAAAAASAEAAAAKAVAEPLMVEGRRLEVDWADPLRYHIHLNGGIKGPLARGPAGGRNDAKGLHRSGGGGSSGGTPYLPWNGNGGAGHRFSYNGHDSSAGPPVLPGSAAVAATAATVAMRNGFSGPHAMAPVHPGVSYGPTRHQQPSYHYRHAHPVPAALYPAPQQGYAAARHAAASYHHHHHHHHVPARPFVNGGSIGGMRLDAENAYYVEQEYFGGSGGGGAIGEVRGLPPTAAFWQNGRPAGAPLSPQEQSWMAAPGFHQLRLNDGGYASPRAYYRGSGGRGGSGCGSGGARHGGDYRMGRGDGLDGRPTHAAVAQQQPPIAPAWVAVQVEAGGGRQRSDSSGMSPPPLLSSLPPQVSDMPLAGSGGASGGERAGRSGRSGSYSSGSHGHGGGDGGGAAVGGQEAVGNGEQQYWMRGMEFPPPVGARQQTPPTQPSSLVLSPDSAALAAAAAAATAAAAAAAKPSVTQRRADKSLMPPEGSPPGALRNAAAAPASATAGPTLLQQPFAAYASIDQEEDDETGAGGGSSASGAAGPGGVLLPLSVSVTTRGVPSHLLGIWGSGAAPPPPAAAAAAVVAVKTPSPPSVTATPATPAAG
ncbi:unnamed protein product, partial [Phaeothamnion confervicola]